MNEKIMLIIFGCLISVLVIFIVWFKAKERESVAALFQALAAVVLIFVTCWYVVLTRQLVDKQNIQLQNQIEQFYLVNRPKIQLEKVEGDVRGGFLHFSNIGNLPADDFKLIWKIIVIDGDKIVRTIPASYGNDFLSTNKIELTKTSIVEPEKVESIYFSSDIKAEQQAVFMVFVWSYKGKGINGPVIKDDFLLWWVQNDSKAWVRTDVVGVGHITAIKQIREKLKKEIQIR